MQYSCVKLRDKWGKMPKSKTFSDKEKRKSMKEFHFYMQFYSTIISAFTRK